MGMIDLKCGDCLELIKEIPDNSIDLIITDPPYLISYKTNRRKNKKHDFCTEIVGDNNPNLIKDYIKECYRILKENTAIYIFCSSKTIDFFKQTIELFGFKIKNIIVWKKNSWTVGDLQAQYAQQYEFIILGNKGRAKIRGKRISDIWEFNRVSGNKQLHQNQKPLDLIKQCIHKHSNEQDIIFDGFMGSGTTGVACKKLNRNFIGYEIDEKYFNIAKERIENTEV